MALPRWLEISLEGGALVLERALANYRTLRRALAGTWEVEAPTIAEQCRALASAEASVEEALARSKRRLEQASPKDAVALEQLLQVVSRERALLLTALRARLPDMASAELLPAVLALETQAEEASLFQRAWAAFLSQRRWLSGLGVSTLSIPLASWWTASNGGTVRTIVNPGALFEDGLALLTLGAASVLMLLARRWSASWTWLGVRRLGSSVPVGVGLSAALPALVHFHSLPAALAAGLVTGWAAPAASSSGRCGDWTQAEDTRCFRRSPPSRNRAERLQERPTLCPRRPRAEQELAMLRACRDRRDERPLLPLGHAQLERGRLGDVVEVDARTQTRRSATASTRPLPTSSSAWGRTAVTTSPTGRRPKRSARRPRGRTAATWAARRPRATPTAASASTRTATRRGT